MSLTNGSGFTIALLRSSPLFLVTCLSTRLNSEFRDVSAEMYVHFNYREPNHGVTLKACFRRADLEEMPVGI